VLLFLPIMSTCCVDHAGTKGYCRLVAGVEIRLEAVPDMGYDPTAEPPAGEVCIRGPPIFSGYYKQLELTQEAIGEWQRRAAVV